MRHFSGTVRARQRAVLSFEVPGRVAGVLHEVGESFGKGAVLARLESEVRRLAVARSRALLREATAANEQAALELRRQDVLLERGASPQAALDEARSWAATTASRVEAAQASLRLAQRALSDTSLRAPYDGVLVERLVEPSQNVQAGTPALRIHGQQGLEVVVEVPESVRARLAVGTVHEVRLSALESASLKGTITEIGATARRGGTFSVYVAVENPPSEWRAGASAEVALDLGMEDARYATIPIPAFIPTAGGGGVVFVLEEDEEAAGGGPRRYIAQRRSIRLSRLANDEAVVKSGLSGDELVVSRGATFLRDGQPVHLLADLPDRYGHE